MFVIIICSIGYQPFPLFVTDIKKEIRETFCLDGALDNRVTNEKAHGKYPCAFLLSRITQGNCPDFHPLEKQKTLLYQYVIMSNYLFCNIGF